MAKQGRGISRREFGRRAALGAAATALVPGHALGDVADAAAAKGAVRAAEWLSTRTGCYDFQSVYTEI